MAKKKPAKKAAKKKPTSKKKPSTKKKVAAKKPAKKSAWNNLPKSYTTPLDLFDDWYNKVASKKVDKIEKKWLKTNKPNDPNKDEDGDYWCVNEMMFNGDAHSLTSENAEMVFIKGYNNQPWTMSQSDSLYCDLDEVIKMAYKAGKECRK